MASDGGAFAASLVDVAVRAAVQAGAPRRTVAATAAAVATAVMVAMRNGAGVGGVAAATPTSSQVRRNKRKRKVAREAQAAASRQPHDMDAAEAKVHAGARENFILVAQETALDIASQRPPPLPAVAEPLPRNMCQHCGQSFGSRNGLFRHLEDSGHGKSSAPSVSDSASGSGFSANLDDAFRVSAPNDTAASIATPMEPLTSTLAGGTAGSCASLDAPSLQRRAQPYPAGKGHRPQNRG